MARCGLESTDTLQHAVSETSREACPAPPPAQIKSKCDSPRDDMTFSSRHFSPGFSNNCRIVIDVPEDILEATEDESCSPSPRVKSATKSPKSTSVPSLSLSTPQRTHLRRAWIARPLKRKTSDASTLRDAPLSSPASIGFDPSPSPSASSSSSSGTMESLAKRRRASLCSDASDSSSQTKVDPPPAPRSILQRASSQRSAGGKSSMSHATGTTTLTGKRSVKFCDEPVYFDYSYRFSKCACVDEEGFVYDGHGAGDDVADATAAAAGDDGAYGAVTVPDPNVRHAVHCKLPEECDGACVVFYSAGSRSIFSGEEEETSVEDGYGSGMGIGMGIGTYGYDVDMFSFDQPDEIPSARRWGFWSRVIAWLRRTTGQRVYTIDPERRRPVISRPQPLMPRSLRTTSEFDDSGSVLLKGTKTGVRRRPSCGSVASRASARSGRSVRTARSAGSRVTLRW